MFERVSEGERSKIESPSVTGNQRRGCTVLSVGCMSRVESQVFLILDFFSSLVVRSIWLLIADE